MATIDRIYGNTGSVGVKAPCAAATTSAITLSGLQTIDGVALAANDRVLVKDQATASQNGIWVAASGAWTRAADFNGSLDVVQGTTVFVINGTTNGSAYWRLATALPVVGTSSLTFTRTMDSASALFTQSGTGAVARSVQAKLREIVSVKDFGAVGDNVTDDTAAFAAAIAAANGKTLYIPAGYYKITSSLSIAGAYFSIEGDGVGSSVLRASGNFAEVLKFTATAAEIKLRHFSIVTTSTTTRCVTLVYGAQVINFVDVQFSGNGAIALVYSQAAGYCTWDQCQWGCDGASTLGLVLDMYNQNTRIFGASRFGGIGSGMAIQKSGSGDRVEGTCIENVQFIVTGGYSLSIGDSLLTQVVNCNLDQASTYGITITSSADDVIIKGNWIGLAAGSTGVCIQYTSANGGGHIIEGNSIYGGSTGIGVSASASLRISSLAIANNKFGNNTAQALSLDSVGDCRITGNLNNTTPTNGSWITAGTHASKGSYYFDNNVWHTTTPALFDTASTYRFGSDRGIVMRNNGVTTTGNGTTTVTVSHGLSRAPSKVIACPKYGTSVGAFFTGSYTSTDFTITWVTATVDANCVWVWEAEV